MERVFAIGDIHGCNSAFHKMLFEEIKIQREDMIYCVGDYIDRGPDSKDVIRTILDLRRNNYHIRTLRGNHEEMMMKSTGHFGDLELWYHNGGNATLESFGIESYDQMESQYKRFFEETEWYIVEGKNILVHAGLDFQASDIFLNRDAMLWVRDFNPSQPVLGDRILIHGHTPKSLHYIRKQKGNCINIDGGCVYNDKKNLGNLVGISLPDKEFIVVENK